ncbi:entericidin A/B family lipoprotein [Methylophaga thiooxydans]|uniref:Entericidin EcnA/B family n=1 Tax=Methylophaga thiooxydans DMS010 TaxID=637616 RepID=C0N610_9GAMM|nr:entericidin A/B family lipoprotein [Methylophaga thiooxydans]EEF80005.1 Entericidin EcnA/B family [Methylophaga thiooxydans DMS010]
MKKMLSLILGLTFALSLTACNTMEGVGQDMEAAGDAIEGEAAENKNY